MFVGDTSYIISSSKQQTIFKRKIMIRYIYIYADKVPIIIGNFNLVVVVETFWIFWKKNKEYWNYNINMMDERENKYKWNKNYY